MLSKEQNDRLTQVGPGTPCGELMRRYWMPFAAVAQFDENPVRKVRLLCEDLIAYRDKSGTFGLIGDRCLHRLVDLQHGMPDECGLRCPYHGWLYDETGACIERPLEANPKANIGRKLAGYPVKELGGMLFTYMGPLPAPELPPWDLYVWPNALRQVAFNTLDCNWLQCQENTGDPLHSVYTHGYYFQYILERQGDFEQRAAWDEHTLRNRVKWGEGIKEVWARETKYGFEKGVDYSKALGAEQDFSRRHSTVIFPFYTSTGGPGMPRADYQARVPIDDTHTLHISYQCYAAPPQVPAPKQDVVPYYEPPLHDENGKPILDYVLAQDAMVWWSQGERTDRSRELLGRTDIPIVLLRKQLEREIAKVESGQEPMNVFRDDPGEIMFGAGHPPDGWTAERPGEIMRKAGSQSFRRKYHKGFAIDDVDRYGPITEDVAELHRRIEEYENALEAGTTVE